MRSHLPKNQFGTYNLQVPFFTWLYEHLVCLLLTTVVGSLLLDSLIVDLNIRFSAS